MKTVVIQRCCADFRLGFFDLLSSTSEIKLISLSRDLGKVKFPTSLSDRPYFSKSFAVKFKDYVLFPLLLLDLLRLNPDVIVSEGGQNTINNTMVLLYCKLRRRKFFVWDLGRTYTIRNKSLFEPIYYSFYSFIMNKSTGILAYNTMSKAYFQKCFPLKPVYILNNTIDTRRLKKIKLDTEVQNKIDSRFSKFDCCLLYVGAINRFKNIEFLEQLMFELGPKYCLIIVGSGERSYVESLEELFRPFNVFFEGYKTMEDSVYYYNVSDFFVLPGLGGLAMNQSLAFGLPVLVNRADGSEFDLVLNGITGYRYDNKDQLIDWIKSRSKEDIKNMKSQSREHINRYFTIENMVGAFVEAISK